MRNREDVIHICNQVSFMLYELEDLYAAIALLADMLETEWGYGLRDRTPAGIVGCARHVLVDLASEQ